MNQDQSKRLASIFDAMNISPNLASEGDLSIYTPVDGSRISSIPTESLESLDYKLEKARHAFETWRSVPAPRRGELVRLFGDELRRNKQHLGALVTLESGKILQEGLGEVQEMIDICDFAVGLSRQLYGLTMPSERPGHKMAEYWHPMGVVGIISAFNFPVAVWSWNAALALVCGNSIVWKPSEKTPLCALACAHLLDRVSRTSGFAPDGLSQLIFGDADIGHRLVTDSRVAVVSATGSTRMGKAVAPLVAQRFGRCILELGGNNAMIVAPSANLQMAVQAIVFSAVGTAGQRCTTLRRLFVHSEIYDRVINTLRDAYAQVRIGNPFSDGVLVGPLIDSAAYDLMQQTLESSKEAGFKVHGGQRVEIEGLESGYYVQPAIVEANEQSDIVRTETFAPILYVMRYESLDEALELHNDVPQGLSSSIFTQNMVEAETFLSALGSDCGIANVNIGPSGAEIGGAFGGEKETGGGRESGTDAWKGYMRRTTATINYSKDLPLAQGIQFSIDTSEDE